MTLDHPTEERLLHALRSYFGYADDQIEFAWNEHDGVHEVALFTYNPRPPTASSFTKRADRADSKPCRPCWTTRRPTGTGN